MGLLSNRVRREDLQAGDHIYSWRFAYSYAHHGIYIGENSVIHFTRRQGEEAGTGTCLDTLFSSSLSRSSSPCGKCVPNTENTGVTLSCLDCFLCGDILYRFQYNENALVFLAKARGGTCTLAISDPPEAVLHRSRHLLANGFGCYHIFHNNCEDFAVYCKTGLLVMERRAIGRSGQAVSFVGAPLAAVFSSPLRFLMAQTWGPVVITAGMYCLSRYAADMGVRKDVAKIAVEDLIVRLFPPLSEPPAEPQNVMANCKVLEHEADMGVRKDVAKIAVEDLIVRLFPPPSEPPAEPQNVMANCKVLERETYAEQEIVLRSS